MLKKTISASIAVTLMTVYGCTGQENVQSKKTEQAKEAELTQRMELQSVRLMHQPRMAKSMAMPVIADFSYHAENRDNYLDNPSNGVQQVATTPLSTFSIDVDTGSYANVRSYLNMGEKPPADAIREEAFINYFPYDYQEPQNKDIPFNILTEVATAPWNKNRTLLKIGLQGYDIPKTERKPSNLVFLIDVSGSMNQQNKLPLLKRSLAMLTNELTKDDTISLVTYAGSTQVVLEATSGDNKKTILNALENLTANGGTNGEGGINLAYQQADLGFKEDGINRILLATDGDFNIGVSNIDQLKQLIKDKRKKGISLTTLGFGRGNYNDALMEQLANTGDGNHAYIDTLHEAKKVLLRQMSGTLQTIASDVKIQVEFNPATVKEYRLIGYQNRLLKDEDFNNDKVDAGEIGAGHSVTALYELTLAGNQGQIDDLRYKTDSKLANAHSGELAQVKVKYKLLGEDKSSRVTRGVLSKEIQPDFEKASEEFQFAASVAAFAQKLKNNHYMDDFSYQQIATIARQNKGSDPYNYRGEFVSLVEIAQSL
ncbi:VWA domain-containing protein [Vibrio hannami]|uniref:vWA domain-containing protein n=1 Tax=Vibrio hannami TaxID=2717094 RepID=UPI0024109F01|nr:VWA domain-containing protein [Vibrio hannami]MDG3085054.1 VWA domain-containing protein [Vibrio hannami]